ncbi:MAG: SusE domain-containing protein [Paludibacter sp.]|nr:SusE domain-containing protein [Paludibacter sp.]
MKKYIIRTLYVFFALILFASCDNNAEITKLGIINFPQTFKSSTNSVVITAANDSTSVISFNWPSVTYGIKAPVTYSLQFDVPSDTLTTTPWSKAVEVTVGNDVLTKSMLGTDLNKIALNSLGLTSGVAGDVVVRVKSYVDRAAYSNVITLSVNPYVPPVVVVGYPSLWVPGDYQGWNPATAPTIVSVNSDKLYEGYINIPAGGTLQYKYTAQANWTPMAYGDGGSGTLIEANYSGGNFTAPSAGYYELSANLNTMTWTATKTTWSILGDATPGLWATDTEMNYDATNQVWTVTCNMVSTGSFKFRANDAWKIDFGIDSTGKLAYADNPLYPYNGNLSNLTVPTSGNYTITLDLHIAGQYTYTLKKN